MNTVCQKYQCTIAMRIKSIRHSNFRVYGSSVAMNLDNQANKPLVFVGGQNGFGKSTFITSILWCLYGKLMGHVDEPFMRMIRMAGGYPAFLESSVNRTHQADGFDVELILEDVELPALSCSDLTIRRSYAQGKENLEILIDGNENELIDSLGFDLFIQEYILPKEVARFFLFDAERITNLAESRGAAEKKELGNAYEKVLGVKRYIEVSDQLHKMLERTLASESDPEVRKDLKKLDADLEKAQSLIESNLGKMDVLLDKKVELDVRREELSLELHSHGFMGDAKDLGELQEEEEVLKGEISRGSASIKGHMDIIPLLFSPTWFNKLSEHTAVANLSIAPAAMDEFIVEVIEWASKNKISGALRDELIAKLERRKDGGPAELSFSAPPLSKVQEVESKLNWLKEWLFSVHIQLKRDRGTLGRLKSKLNRLNRSGSNADVVSLRATISDLEEKRDEIQQQRMRLVVESEQLERSIQNIQKQRSELLKKIEVGDRNVKKLDVLNGLIEKIELFVEAFKEQRRKNLETRISDALKSMFHKKHLIDSVSIALDHTGMELSLLNQEGQVISKDSLSMGEKQLYAVALLKALIDESGMDFPVVVDSPLQKLDPNHAMTLLDEVFPHLASQVFVLPLPNKELTEGEFNRIAHRVNSLHLIKHERGVSRIQRASKSEFFEMDLMPELESV